MRIGIYGGSFNPPHCAHLRAADIFGKEEKLDRLLIIPTYTAPHKAMSSDDPGPEERLLLCRLLFARLPGAEVSDLEARRGGRSYTADTIRQLRKQYPDDELLFLMGTDMLLTFTEWYDYRYLLDNLSLVVLPRERGREAELASAAQALQRDCGARVRILKEDPMPMASTDIRTELKNRRGMQELTDEVYSHIIKNRLYGSRPDFAWLREKAYAMLKPTRVKHVQGVEAQAVRLARRWGGDEERAAEAGILHDITKKLSLKEQLILCGKYDIICDNLELENEKLLHAKTGAAVAEDLFGADPQVRSAVRWHTTGRPAMSQLEKIIYLADYIEPTRDFEGIDELRRLCDENLDAAMELGLRMSIEDVRANGREVHPDSIRAWNYYRHAVRQAAEK